MDLSSLNPHSGQLINKAIVVRHGERPPVMGEPGASNNGIQDDLLELTPVGRLHSYNLGTIFKGQVFGIKTSPVLRCRQTAEYIALGSGIHPETIQVSSILAPEASSLERFSESERQQAAFHLLSGSATGPLQSKIDAAVHQMLVYFREQVSSSEANVFVSHDWVMSLLMARTTPIFSQHSWSIWPAFGSFLSLILQEANCISAEVIIQ